MINSVRPFCINNSFCAAMSIGNPHRTIWIFRRRSTGTAVEIHIFSDGNCSRRIPRKIRIHRFPMLLIIIYRKV